MVMLYCVFWVAKQRLKVSKTGKWISLRISGRELCLVMKAGPTRAKIRTHLHIFSFWYTIPLICRLLVHYLIPWVRPPHNSRILSVITWFTSAFDRRDRTLGKDKISRRTSLWFSNLSTKCWTICWRYGVLLRLVSQTRPNRPDLMQFGGKLCILERVKGTTSFFSPHNSILKLRSSCTAITREIC